jgi:glycogen synthase
LPESTALHRENHKLRVCLLSREYPPETGWGGIATFTRHLALGLKELGHEVEVVCLSPDDGRCVEQEGILVHRVQPFFKDNELGLTGTFMPHFRHVMTTAPALWLKFLERHREKTFDVVDAPELLADGLFAAVTRIAPLVVRLYTPRSKFIAERLNHASDSFDHQMVAISERLAMVQADVLTSPSMDLAKHIASDLNYSLDRIRIVSNPIDADEFSPEPPDSAKSFHGEEGRHRSANSEEEEGEEEAAPTVLFVGRLEERKGIEFLIEAIPLVSRQIPEVRFLIVGDDTNYGADRQSMRKRLEKSLARSGASTNVVFSPRVPLNQLPSLYRRAAVCVVPSVYDNSPYSCLEAMSCGRAVITTDSGGAKEYLEHGVSGLVIAARDANALATAIVSLLKDQPLRLKLGARARDRVLTHFQRTAIAQKTVELYDEACKSFHKQGSKPLYAHDPTKAAGDARNICESIEASLYEMLYRVSYRHRLGHWNRLARRRPRLFMAKVGSKLIQTFGINIILPKQAERLKQMIKKQEKPGQ